MKLKQHLDSQIIKELYARFGKNKKVKECQVLSRQQLKEIRLCRKK